jgi:uncharacterized protein YjiK
MTKTKIFMVMLAVFLPTIVFASDPWPSSDLTGTQIANYAEASGIVYHQRLGTFFVVLNSGCVKQINLNGTELSSWCASSWTDLEGITLAEDDNYLYLGLESPQTIYEFSISANNLTGKSWTLSGMNVASGQGLEALEYVNGYFYAGSQYDAKIYVYQINLASSGAGTFIRSFYPYSSYTNDLSALSYSGETDTLYALYDSGNRLVTTDGNGNYINRYQLPSGTMNEEGFVVVPNCPNSMTYAIITEDSGRIMRFSGFSIDNTRCAVEPEPETYEVVLIDNGSSFLSNIQSILSANTDYDDYVTITWDDVINNGIPESNLLVISGGTDFTNYLSYTSLSLNSTIINNLQNYTGGVVAICGGADVISRSIDTTYYSYLVNLDMAGLVPVDSETHSEWLASGQKPGVQFTDSYIAGSHAEEYANTLYYGGPVPKNYNLNDIAVVANYTSDLVSPYYAANGEPAIFAYNNIIYSAIHPESSASYQDLLLNMLSYANGTLAEPAPEPEPEPAPVDNDADGYSVENDCNDNDATVHSTISYYIDADLDGYGSTSTALICASTAPSGYSTNYSDCNDSSSAIKPSAAESCNNIDDNCNGSIDENLATYTYYRDADSDTLGSKTDYVSTCVLSAPSGYVSNNNDYDDTLSNYGVEIYGDKVDNDADGKIDEVNIVAENGYHPGLMNIDPADGQYLISYAGMTNGRVKVTYSDESIYVYKIFNVRTNKNTSVSRDGNSANLIVTDARNRRIVMINGYTGIIGATIKKASLQKKVRLLKKDRKPGQ